MSDRLTPKLWEAFDLLRGEYDPWTRFNVVTSFLVLKLAAHRPTLVRVPPAARWEALLQSGNPAEAVARALQALKSANPDSIGTDNAILQLPKGFKARTATSLIVLFNDMHFAPAAPQYREDFGGVFERALHRLADTEGKRRAEFTMLPSFLAKLMARLADIGPGQKVYDPFAGSGELLTAARSLVISRHGRDVPVHLFGQSGNAALGDIARINFLFHGIADFVLLDDNALYAPLPDASGSWRMFDRVLTAPPFAMKYRQQDIGAPERMRYGWTSERGGRADLMMLQHVLASLQPEGVGVMLVPQGVLFRSGPEGRIRQGIVEDDRIAAIIGLGSGALPKTAAPACILILRGHQVQTRQDTSKTFFVEAGRDIAEARDNSILEAEIVEKIVSTIQERKSISGFSRTVSRDEIAARKFDLNIPAYLTLDSAAIALPDVHATLFGGVPTAEVEAQLPRFRAFGVDRSDMFEVESDGYLSFLQMGVDATVHQIEKLALQAEQRFDQQCRAAWESISPRIEAHVHAATLTESLNDLAELFYDTLYPAGVLDSFELRGVWVSWVSAHEGELEHLAQRGFDNALTPQAEELLTLFTGVPADAESPRRLMALGRDLCARAVFRASLKRRKLSGIFRAWAARYGTSLQDLEAERARRAAALSAKLRSMGYR